MVKIGDIVFQTNPDDQEHANFWNSVSSGSWEPYTFEIMKKYLRLYKSYIDIGAWIGPTVLYGAQLARNCFAFEPDSVAFKILMQNLAENPGIQNVIALNNAIAPATGPVRIGAHSHYGDSMTGFYGMKDHRTVSGISLESILAKLPDINFIKMDIEGGEAEILPAAISSLRGDRAPTLYLSLHGPMYPGSLEDYFNLIIPAIAQYKYILDGRGQQISLDGIRQLTGYQAIVCTNEKG